MAVFQVDRLDTMFLFCSNGVNRSFSTALDPDPGELRALGRPGCRWRNGGVAFLPRWFTALQRWAPAS